MIANRGRGRWSGKTSFADCIGYITRQTGLSEPLTVWSENVASVETAWIEMEAIAAHSRSSDPLYHLIISWAPHERPSLESVSRVLDAQREALGFQGLQYVAAMHDDGVGGMTHLHAVINLVDPMTLTLRPTWHDWTTLRDTCRQIELEDSWRVPPLQVNAAPFDGSNAADRYGVRRRFREWVKAEVKPRIEALFASSSGSWPRLSSLLDEYAVRYEVISSLGARLTAAMSGCAVRLSDIGFSHASFVERWGDWLGPIEQSRSERDATLFDRLERARETMALAPTSESLAAVHTVLAQYGVALDRKGNSMRVVDLDGPGWVSLRGDDSDFSLKALKARYGSFVPSEDVNARDRLRRSQTHDMSVRQAQGLASNPQPLLDTLFAGRSLVRFDDLAKEVRRRVSSLDLAEDVIAASLRRMTVVNLEAGDRLTTPSIQAEEQSILESARLLASRPVQHPMNPARPPVPSSALAYATSPDSSIKLLSNIGHLRTMELVQEMTTLYRAQGCRVRCVSSSEQTTEALREYTNVPTQSIRRALSQFQDPNAPTALSANDVVILADASALGSEHASRLLEAATKARAVVIAFGSDHSLPSPVRGDLSRLLRVALGYRVFEQERPLLPSSPGLPLSPSLQAAQGVRAASDSGALHEFDSQADTVLAALSEYRRLLLDGSDAYIQISNTQERIELTRAARSIAQTCGRLNAHDYVVETADGPVEFSIGEEIIFRDGVSPFGIERGASALIKEISGAVIDVVFPGGVELSIDTLRHPSIHSACVVSESPLSSDKRHAVLQIVTGDEGGTGTYIGAPSSAKQYGLFYARENFPDGINDVLHVATESFSKDLALDGIFRGSADLYFSPKNPYWRTYPAFSDDLL